MNYATFDPWNSSKAEKRNVYDSFLTLHMEGDEDVEIPEDLATAFNKLCAWGFIMDSKEFIEGKQSDQVGRTVLICMKKAIEAGISIPDWLGKTFCQRVKAVISDEVKTWSDEKSFGRERPKGSQQGKLGRKERIGQIVDLAFMFMDKDDAEDETFVLPGEKVFSRERYSLAKRWLLRKVGLPDIATNIGEVSFKLTQANKDRVCEAFQNSAFSDEHEVPDFLETIELSDSSLEQIHQAFLRNMPNQSPWEVELMNEE